MYGLTPDLQIDGMVDQTLDQICIGKYDVQFRFSSGTYIAVQGGARILEDGEIVASWTEDGSWSDMSFHKLLNQLVREYSIPDPRLLRITFDDSLALELLDSSDQYESMQIYPHGSSDSMIVI